MAGLARKKRPNIKLMSRGSLRVIHGQAKGIAQSCEKDGRAEWATAHWRLALAADHLDAMLARYEHEEEPVEQPEKKGS